MATTNGKLTPPPAAASESVPVAPTSGDKKRKREDDVKHEDAPTSRSAQTQRDILEILQQHDPEPSFLAHAVDPKSSVTDRSPKKARLSEPSSTTTIASRLASGAYASLAGLQLDAAHVSDGLLASVRTKAKEREGQNGRLLVSDLKQMQRTQAFQQIVKDVVEQQAKYDAAHGHGHFAPKPEPNGLLDERLSESKAEASRRHGTVLTLFGNAPTPKQLFSSMQNSLGAPADPLVKTELPVEEMSLPTGLAATKIMPIPADDKRSGPTFEDAFPPPYNLPALHPPKTHRRSATRDETIKWEFKDPLATRSKKGGYTTQSSTVGEWLGYGGLDAKDEPSSPREKRKLRDRALSGGESSQPPPNKSTMDDALAKEEESLFRRAYSSFAPSCDNSRSIIAGETKSMVWWHKIGHRKYDEIFAIDPALSDEQPAALPEIVPPSTSPANDFGNVVEEMDDLVENDTDSEPTRDKTDVDQVLQQISELLETLESHQRIRNATLQSAASASRTPISPGPNIVSRIGRPDSPSEDEVSVYRSLRREIAYLVLQLPPYALAKLNGDQMAELGVSTLINFEAKNVKGTMEEDQVARLAKYTAMATAAGIATLTRTGSGSQHYSSTSQRTPAIGQAANTRYGQPNQYSRGPTGQPQFNRSISNQSTYGTPSATAPRPGYGQPNQYSRPGAAQPGYGQPNGQNYYRSQVPPNTPGYGGYGSQYNQSTPQLQQRPGYPSSQPLAQYQQRSQATTQNAIAYQANGQSQVQSPFNRTASPLKPANYQPPLQPSPIPRAQQQYQPPPQPGSDRATPSSYPSQPQTPVNGFPAQQRPVAPRMSSGTPQPPPVQANGHARASSFSGTSATPSVRGEGISSSKDWRCEYCGKVFDRHSTYAVHMRTHTGERPYHCEYEGCGREFTVRSNLTRHVRTTHQGLEGGEETEDGSEEL